MGQVSPSAAADALLSSLVAQLQQGGITLPKRTGKVPGNMVAWDAEQFVVSWGNLSRGQPLAPSSNQPGALPYYETVLFYDFHLTWLVEVAAVSSAGTKGLPSPAKLDSDFDQLSTMAVGLANGLMEIHRSGTIVEVNIPFAWGPIEPIGPEGKLAGVICPVTFQAGMNLDGEY